MARIRICLILFVVIVNFGCVRRGDESAVSRAEPQASEPALVIRPAESPATGDSREPELTATPDGRVVLSWVEKTGAKRYALRAVVLERHVWGGTLTVAEGDNWFVNWADFPSVIGLTDGTLAAHWLVRSGSATYAYDVNIARSESRGA